MQKQVEYFQNLLPKQKEIKIPEEIIYPDELGNEAFGHSEDYGFYGTDLNKENSMGSSAFFLTIIFGFLCVISFFTQSTGKTQGSQTIESGYKPKDIIIENNDNTISSIYNFIMNPYLLFVFYVAFMGILFIWNEKNWSKRKLRKFMTYIRTHSKAN